MSWVCIFLSIVLRQVEFSAWKFQFWETSLNYFTGVYLPFVFASLNSYYLDVPLISNFSLLIFTYIIFPLSGRLSQFYLQNF